MEREGRGRSHSWNGLVTASAIGEAEKPGSNLVKLQGVFFFEKSPKKNTKKHWSIP